MFDPKECERLAREMAEDDERATGERWGNDGIDVYTLTDSGQGFPMDRYPDSVDVIAGKCERCGERLGVLRADDELAIARLRNNAHAASEQLRAAVEEVEKLWAQVENGRATVGAQRAASTPTFLEATVLRPLTEGEIRRALHEGRAEAMAATGDNAWATIVADRERLLAEVERLTKLNAVAQELEVARVNLIDSLNERRFSAEQDLAKYRALVEQMRPVYEAAVEWRKTMDWSASRAHKEQFTCEVTLVDAIDTALAAPKEEP